MNQWAKRSEADQRQGWLRPGVEEAGVLGLSSWKSGHPCTGLISAGRGTGFVWPHAEGDLR